MIFWSGPFNKIVRSNEAGFVGILIGIMIGVALMVFVPTHVENTHYKKPATLCGGADKVKYINYTHIGTVKKVKCTDGRELTDFK